MSIYRTLALLTLVIVAPLVACDIVGARNTDGRYDAVDPKIRDWVRGLKDANGVGCCDTADGYPADVEWDMAEQAYRVRIEGVWYNVPPEAVLTEPNRLGYATVWWVPTYDAAGKMIPKIRCFLPGGGT